DLSQVNPIDRHRSPRTKTDDDLFGIVRGDVGIGGHPEHTRWWGLPGVFEDPTLVRDMEKVGVHGIWRFFGDRGWDATSRGIRNEIGPPFEIPLPPGCDGPEVWGQSRRGELESHLVIALAGGTMGDRRSPVFSGGLDQTLGDDGSGQRRAQQVLPLLNRSRPDRRAHRVSHERLLTIVDDTGDGSGGDGFGFGFGDLSPLTDITGVGNDIGVVFLPEPGEDYGGIKTSRVGKNNFHRAEL